MLFEKRSRFTDVSCLRSHHVERSGTRLVAVCVIRGFVSLFQVIDIQFKTIVFAKRFIFQSVVLFCPKLNVIHSCRRLTVFPLETPIWQRFTNVPCLRSYHRKRTRTCSIPEVKPYRARIVLRWLTAWKYLVLQTVFFCCLLHD